MRASTAPGLLLRLRLSASLLLPLAIAATSAAQPIHFGFASPQSVELTPPRVDAISGATAARLEQARALAADENWEEAVDVLRELAADDARRVVALDNRRYVDLRAYCHLQLARMPSAGLAVYRRRVDPLAEQWYRQGLVAHDERLLRRIVEELFCSSWGDDALFALGELALERADYAAARRWWEQISPLLRDGNGRPLWLALRNIDLNAHWPEVELRWLERENPVDWLAYPDTELDLADVWARLILVSLRAGEFERAAVELDVFRRLHPAAEGRLGGQVGTFVAALERLLTSAGEWPEQRNDPNWRTFAGSQTRSSAAIRLGATLTPVWSKPVAMSPAGRISNRAPSGLFDESNPIHARESQRPLSTFPIIIDNFLLFADAAGVHAADLASGQPAVTADGLLQRNDLPGERTTSSWFGEDVMDLAPRRGDRAVFGAVIEGRPIHAMSIAYGVPRYTLTAAGDMVLGRIGHPATTRLESRQSSPGDRLVGLDLTRDGLLAFRARPPGADWSFDGAPVSDGRRVYVAMRHSDVSPHAYVACFDVATGAQLWRTSIGSADTPAAGESEITHNLLTLVDDRIYFNTNLGLVAALDANHGAICWLHRYDRHREPFMAGVAGPLHFDRDPSPCLYHNGLLIVAPADTPQIFALDADTGQAVWTNDQLPDALHLLGVVRQNLIVTGHRLSLLDVRSGQVQFIWPESEHAGIRGMGRGLIAGEEVFWPTRNEIYVVSALTGERTRSPFKLDPLGNGGANLAAGHGYLIAAGHDKLIALSSREDNPREASNSDP